MRSIACMKEGGNLGADETLKRRDVSIGYYNRAISDCNNALAINPNDASTWSNRGYAYTLLRNGFVE